MKVVLDTNVIISGLFWNKVPGEVLEICRKRHTLCFTNKTLKELYETLSYSKFKPHILKLPFEIEEFLSHLTEKSLIISGPFPKISVIREDPADDKFLACAVSCQASFIVAGDKHLLKLKEFQGISIVSPREFLRIIRK